MFNQEGKVVVQIRVNAAGNVIDAREAKGGNVSDKQTIQIALDAARRAKFTEGDHDQIGTITYIFKIKQ
jgi:TonB family protein